MSMARLTGLCPAPWMGATAILTRQDLAGQVRAEVIGGDTIVSGIANTTPGANFAITPTEPHALTERSFIL